ncbi:hypothetical protein LX32DRAFT_109225 [Colletotrichum zoysiae]|uniref:Uncharacterized protein n=1 Tax=Colletotrichum zoysiae TaxID=1216348 RepID=A0AAD9HAD2_9PEZI|nr:hypothetical protein LX32DRAFT_109225 [Colletotrichum zoysiae]
MSTRYGVGVDEMGKTRDGWDRVEPPTETRRGRPGWAGVQKAVTPGSRGLVPRGEECFRMRNRSLNLYRRAGSTRLIGLTEDGQKTGRGRGQVFAKLTRQDGCEMEIWMQASFAICRDFLDKKGSRTGGTGGEENGDVPDRRTGWVGAGVGDR